MQTVSVSVPILSCTEIVVEAMYRVLVGGLQGGLVGEWQGLC